MPGEAQMHFQLGKRTGRASGEDVELPTGPDTEGMAGRVRAILEEIRARASDSSPDPSSSVEVPFSRSILPRLPVSPGPRWTNSQLKSRKASGRCHAKQC